MLGFAALIVIAGLLVSAGSTILNAGEVFFTLTRIMCTQTSKINGYKNIHFMYIELTPCEN